MEQIIIVGNVVFEYLISADWGGKPMFNVPKNPNATAQNKWLWQSLAITIARK